MKPAYFAALTLLLGARLAFGADPAPADPGLTPMEWSIGGVSREAIVRLPLSFPAGGAPLVFVFHGRNNKIPGFVNYFPVHRGWPEAVVVYMQGLVMPGPKPKKADGTEKSGTGWQVEPGGQEDRDLKFFDAVLATLRQKYAIDHKRVYAAGHSNGAAFAYLLWQKRPAVFAAFAPVAGGLMSARGSKDPSSLLVPKPVLQIAGRNDTTVPFALMEMMVAIVKRSNACEAGPEPWGDGLGQKYPSPLGAPVVTFFHPGGHGVPKEAVSLIVSFFKEHSLSRP